VPVKEGPIEECREDWAEGFFGLKLRGVIEGRDALETVDSGGAMVCRRVSGFVTADAEGAKDARFAGGPLILCRTGRAAVTILEGLGFGTRPTGFPLAALGAVFGSGLATGSASATM
jgi:hypothetical protein